MEQMSSYGLRVWHEKGSNLLEHYAHLKPIKKGYPNYPGSSTHFYGTRGESFFQHEQIGAGEEVQGEPSDSSMTYLCNLPPTHLVEQPP